MKRLATFLLGAMGFYGCPDSQAAVIANGSFESFSGSVPDSWVVSGNLGISAAQGTTDGSFAVAFSIGNLPSTGVLSQTFTTIPGGSYMFSFDFGKYSVNQPNEVARLGYDIFDGTDFTGALLLGGTAIDDTPGIGDANSPSSSAVYNPYLLAFTATGTSATVRFTDTSDPQSGGGGFDAMLDNVVVTLVPEPCRATMLLLSAFGLLMQRRRSH